MKNRVVPRLSLSRVVLLAVAAIAALVGPVVIGSVRASQGPRGGDVSFELAGYRIGSIDIVGSKALDNDTIRAALGLVPGDYYDESKLRRGFENLRKRYGDLGYINDVPQPEFELDVPRKVMTLIINIDEGPQYTINRIRFVGNTTTSDDVLRRAILLKEGTVFSASTLETSLAKLNQLGLFEPIHIEDAQIDASPTEPKVDVSFRVKEKTR